ncbi:hypothetical protein ACSX1A_10720 [Pontibacter sp. MBLB2868]|uniref:hypothetical protein n=1 Tax=Pontibacter sp. MBLB2868 TaxID=3451555 RepID=UPI003F750CB4
MKITLLSLLLLISVSNAKAQQIKVLTGFASPESVLQQGKLVYVSNVGHQLQPAQKDGDGYISLLSAEGEMLEQHFLPLPADTLHAPKGMVINGNTLYVTDIDRVVGFDLKSRRKTFDLKLHSVSAFLNDIEVLDKQQLVVTATDAGKIFKVNITGKGSFEELILPIKIIGANGLKYDPSKKILYVNGFGENGQPTGELYAVTIGKPSTAAQITQAKGYYDGLALTTDAILLSSWVSFDKAGEIIAINLKDGSLNALALPIHFAGPADMWLDSKEQVLWVPTIMDGKVYRIALNGR